MKRKDEEPKLWVTVLKLVVGAIVLVGGTGLALWYADKMQDRAQPGLGSSSDVPGWGIVGDSPTKNRR